YPVSGEIREVLPPEQLVYTWIWGAAHGDEIIEERETLVTVELRAVGDMTELTLTHARMRSRDSAESHAGGWTSCFVCLDRLLAAYP
ncbi:MAG: SRPBCC domain-containing protein, partial [Alphaproteobacteria bacterium]|nr:SRPBCC domain-containing protein [Alphaproteobacteria bacterium]